jgi:hypothetical protein
VSSKINKEELKKLEELLELFYDDYEMEISKEEAQSFIMSLDIVREYLAL